MTNFDRGEWEANASERNFVEWGAAAPWPDPAGWVDQPGRKLSVASEPRRGGKTYWRTRAEAAEAQVEAVRGIVRDVANDAGDDRGCYGDDYHAGMVTVAARILQALAVDAPEATR